MVLPSHMHCRYLPAGQDPAGIEGLHHARLMGVGREGGVLRKGVVKIRAKIVVRHANPAESPPREAGFSPGRPDPGLARL